MINADEDDPEAAGAIVLILGNDRQQQRAKASSLAGKRSGCGDHRCHRGTRRPVPATRQQLPTLAGEAGRDGRLRVGKRFQCAGGKSRSHRHSRSASRRTPTLTFDGPATSDKKYTWNAVGILRGSDPELQTTAVLLSAHLDHLGIGQPVNGDDIYNGADDDASGTTAVLELARVLGSGPKPRRTVIFALFGSEETGGQGSTFFLQHPPVPLKQIAVNLEFEMLGRADPAVKSDTVWLTGWERSNLGPTLAARGAKLVAIPIPSRISSRAPTIMSWPKKAWWPRRFRATDCTATTTSPATMSPTSTSSTWTQPSGRCCVPVRWLVNSSFTPQWNAGGRP